MFRVEKFTDKVKLTIYGYVGGYYMDFRAIEQVLHEITTEGFKKLEIWMHTYGGDVVEGNLIINFLENFKKLGGTIDLYMPGVMASMGAVIMTVADKRYIADNALIMIHVPSGGVNGNANDFENYAKLLRNIEKDFITRLTSLTGKSEQEVKTWFDGSDHWFDAHEAIELGFADGNFNSVVDIEVEEEDYELLGAKGVYEKFVAITNKKDDIMDKKVIIARYGLTTVTEANSEEEIYAAIDAKLAEANKTASDNEAVAKEAVKKGIEASVSNAIAGKKISEQKKEEYIALGEKVGVEALNKIFADMQVYKPITSQIKGEGSGGQNNDDLSWDEYQEKKPAELEAMVKTDPEKFKAIYKTKFGVAPEL